MLPLIIITLISAIGIILILQKKISHAVINLFIALGAGSMLSVSLLHIFPEIVMHSTYGAIAFLGGFVGMYILEEIFTPHSHDHKHEDHTHEDPHEHSHHIAYVTFLALFVHTIFDGIAIRSSLELGSVTSMAIIFGVAIHQIPASLSLSAIFKKSKISQKWQIVMLCLFALAVAIGYAISDIFIHHFSENFNTIAVAIAGGTLLYIATVDLLPMIHSEGKKKLANICVFLLGVGILTAFHFWGTDIHGHNHNHEHSHSEHTHEKLPHQEGVFEDSAVMDRSLTDYSGSWQSLYPYLLDGTLDAVMEHKAEQPNASKTAEEYKQYYLTGYATDISKIEINGKTGEIIFEKGNEKFSAQYQYDGFEILTYASGKKGVRYLFSSQDNTNGAPKFVQFSDHEIYPTRSAHFHIFMGNESHEKLLEEMDNWPTYYPSNLNAEEIVEEMIHH